MPNFDEVKAAEQQEIYDARIRRRDLFAKEEHEMPAPDDADRVGLAFSGGGIRSATFNLGILQGLARYNLLQRIDYVSTVSGGGYIGSWLISWIRRWGLEDAIRGLASSPPSPPLNPTPPPPLMKPAVQPPPNGTYTEAAPINFLRAYSNYLTPQLGALSADVWEAVASYVRNLLLNLTILVLFLSAVLLLPRFWEAVLLEIADYTLKSSGSAHPCLILGVGALFLLAITTATWNIASHTFPELLKNPLTKQKGVLLLVVAPLFLAAPLGSITLWLGAPNLSAMGWGSWAKWGCIVYGLVRLFGLVLSGVWLGPIMGVRPAAGWWQEVKDGCWLAGFAFVAGGLGGVLTGWIARKFSAWAPLVPCLPVPHASGIAKVACWGTPLLLGALLLTGVLHIGLMSLKFNNEKREWWARMTGWLLICSLVGAGLFGLGIYAPLGIGLLGGYVKTKTALIGGWILSTLGGLLAGKSGATSGTSGTSSKLEIVAKIAPFVFVVGLLVALSCGVHSVASLSATVSGRETGTAEQSAHVSGELQLIARDSSAVPAVTLTDLKLTYSAKPPFDAEKIKEKFWGKVKQSAGTRRLTPNLTVPGWAWLLCASLSLALIALVLSARVDINEFSMHLFYRNRLVRCYLGASNDDRKPQQFTGFDPKDDTLLKEFSAKADPYEDKYKRKIEYAGPYPILNCTLTVTHGERLAWQERKGESFIFTPRYCGYEFQEQSPMEGAGLKGPGQDAEKNEPDGYQKTGGYAYPPKGVYLGTALATSGAAVNPNMGFHTSSALAFLLTVFNVRLGWWLGNPRHPKAQGRATPLFGMFYMLMELFALTSDRSRYVNLSDGFHFENLGLYELVRRRCKYIIVGDAGADPEHSFDDLANAIRKCRTDFGIEIEMDLAGLELDKDKRFSQAHAVTGVIRYDLIDARLKKGILVYFKPTLTDADPVDIQNYRTLHPAFPHQSTANQWFDESQFESYRQLGRVSMETALELVGSPHKLLAMPTNRVFEDLATLL
jgi:hypothetical protein